MTLVVPPTATGSKARNEGAATGKLLRVLEAVAAPGGPHRLADITHRAGVPKSTAHRLVTLLTAENYLVSINGSYGIGPQLRALAAQVMGTANDGVRGLLADLQHAVGGHTVHLAMRSGDHAVYIGKIDGDTPYQMASRVGMSIPLHCTAIGKAILSTLPADDVDGIVQRAGLPRRTPATVTDRDALAGELATVRSRGYAVDEEENEPTIRCIAVPVTGSGGQPGGAVSVSTVSFMVPREELDAFAAPLKSAAAGLAQVLH